MYQPSIGLAVKCAVGSLARRAVKSAWMKSPKPLGNPNPTPGTGQLSDFRLMQINTHDTLSNLLGREPTQEEFHAQMKINKRAARLAGHPVSNTNPDNSPTYQGPDPIGYNNGYGVQNPYPYTQTNREFRQLTKQLLPPPDGGRPKYAPGEKKQLVKEWMDVVRYQNRQARTYSIDPNYNITRQPITMSPIDPNARVRTYWPTDSPGRDTLNVDPRVPEYYNARSPFPGQASLSPLTPAQVDQIRLQYYTKYPQLQPVPGQVGYAEWQAQQQRMGR